MRELLAMYTSGIKEEFRLGWQDCQQAVTYEFLCIMSGCVFGNRCMPLNV